MRKFICVAILLGLLSLLSPGLVAAQNFDWQAYKGTTIRVIQNKGTSGLAIEALLPEFEKLTGIKVQYETYTEDQYRQKVLLELGAGTGGLDAFYTFAAQEGLKFWRSGWYEPLDAYLKNPKLTDPAFDLQDIASVALKGNTYDGKLTSLPIQQNTTMLYYRKDIFDRMKVKFPTNIAELEEAAKKLNNAEEGGQKVVGITLRGKKAAATSQWAPFLLGMGGTWLKDGKPAIASPESVAALDLYGRLLRLYGPPGSVNYHWYECVSQFVQGKAAMFIDVNARIFYFEDPSKSQVVGKVGYTMMPGGPAGVRPTMEVASMAISSKSKKKEAAYLFIQWTASKDVTLKVLQRGVPVPRISAWKDPRFFDKMKQHQDWIDASMKSMEIASTNYNPPVIAVSEVRDAVGEAIVSSILGENVKAAADKANAEMAKIMEKTEGK